MTSPLAVEILGDLEAEFPDGATVGALREWLGEKPGPLKSALNELHTARRVTRIGTRYFPADPEMDADEDSVCPTGSEKHAAALRLLRARVPAGQIQAELGLTKGQLAGIRYRATRDGVLSK